MTRARRRSLRILIFLLVVTGSGFALRQLRHKNAETDLPSAAAKKGEFLVLVRCRGELASRRSEQLVAPLDVSDLQIIWAAPAGGAVKKDQAVVRFDPARTQQELKERNASLQQAQSTLDQAVAQGRITEDQDKLDLATANYNMEKARIEASKQSIVSALQGEESKIDLTLAEEKLKVQQTAMVTHGKANEQKIAALQRALDTAKRLVALTEENLTLMELKSPLDGVVSYMMNYSGGWMNAQPFKVGDHAVPGSVIAEIPDLSTLEMETKVEEVDRGRIVVGDDVLVHVDAFPEKVIHAKLVAISPLTEQSFNEWPPTRSFKAYARPDSLDAALRPGMNAGADVVQMKIRDAVSIPAKALFTVNGKPSVYVKTGDAFLPREVKVKAKNPDEIAIEGIAAGTIVALAEPVKDKK